jgi:hypothetical protein
MKNKENIVINKIQAAENVTDNTSKKLKKKSNIVLEGCSECH